MSRTAEMDLSVFVSDSEDNDDPSSGAVKKNSKTSKNGQEGSNNNTIDGTVKKSRKKKNLDASSVVVQVGEGASAQVSAENGKDKTAPKKKLKRIEKSMYDSLLKVDVQKRIKLRIKLESKNRLLRSIF